MKKKGFSAEQVIGKLREAEVLLSQGSTVGEVSRKLGVTEQTYYRWRREYGGMRVEQARRLKELEKENGRLKRLVADLTLDNAILKETTQGNFWARCGGGRRRLGFVRKPSDLPTAGMQGVRAGSIDSAAGERGFRGRREGGGSNNRLGNSIWSVWVSEDYGSAQGRGVASEP